MRRRDIASVALRRCSNGKVAAHAARQAQAAVESPLVDVADAYYAVHILAGLNHQAQPDPLNAIALSLAKLKKGSGLIAAYTGGPASVTSTGLAYAVLAKLKELTVLPTEHAEAAEDVLSSIPKVTNSTCSFEVLVTICRVSGISITPLFPERTFEGPGHKNARCLHLFFNFTCTSCK